MTSIVVAAALVVGADASDVMSNRSRFEPSTDDVDVLLLLGLSGELSGIETAEATLLYGTNT